MHTYIYAYIYAYIPTDTNPYRYKLQLDPSINHGPWSAEEDHVLLEMHKVVGNQWCKIAQCLEGRTEHSVKARHACIMRIKVGQ
jgi:myb proto-oncogene protein